jgi:hypothetical protein
VATACEAYLEHDLGEKFGVRLAAQVTSALHKSLQSVSNRTANIGLQTYYAAEQARILAIHTLRFITDLVESPDELPLIIKVAQEQAWKNMTTMHRHQTTSPAAQEEYD